MGKNYWISQQNQDYMQKILPKKYFIKQLKQQKIDGKQNHWKIVKPILLSDKNLRNVE